MDAIRLVRVSAEYAGQIDQYRAEFPAERMRVTLIPERIPGLDYLEDFSSAEEWLRFCDRQRGRISWYLSVRENDGTVVGACCLRHKLEYDDDDEDFASHIGYSVRPTQRRKGYAKAQLRLLLREAEQLGMSSVRIVCRDINAGSRSTILACGGQYVDSLYGEESGMTICRYDVSTKG